MWYKKKKHSSFSYQNYIKERVGKWEWKIYDARVVCGYAIFFVVICGTVLLLMLVHHFYNQFEFT